MRIIEFLVEGDPSKAECERATWAVLGALVSWVDSFEDAPSSGMWGTCRVIDGGEFRMQVLVVRIPDGLAVDEKLLYEDVSNTLGSAVLVPSESPDPYEFCLWKDGAWTLRTVDVRWLDQYEFFVLEDAPSYEVWTNMDPTPPASCAQLVDDSVAYAIALITGTGRSRWAPSIWPPPEFEWMYVRSVYVRFSEAPTADPTSISIHYDGRVGDGTLVPNNSLAMLWQRTGEAWHPIRE